MPENTMRITAGNVAVGDIYVKRNSRGNIAFTGSIREIMPCTDFANVHLTLMGVRSSKGREIVCHFKGDSIELL